MISPPSSRLHRIFGSGYPRALHTNLADPPSGIIISPEVSSYTISGGITTSRKALYEHIYTARVTIFYVQVRVIISRDRDEFYLAFHRVRIDLTHIRAPVFSSNSPNV